METSEILKERRKTHGSFPANARIMQLLKKNMRSTKNWQILSDTQREALEMVAHKIGRILTGDPNWLDHWDDIAGYSKLVADDIRESQNGTQDQTPRQTGETSNSGIQLERGIRPSSTHLGSANDLTAHDGNDSNRSFNPRP